MTYLRGHVFKRYGMWWFDIHGNAYIAWSSMKGYDSCQRAADAARKVMGKMGVR